jgi:formate hydrogenlyase subunit 6/NADH:ubiquinone oxidoreductase subunit I
MRWVKTREIREAAVAFFSRPLTTRYPRKPFEPDAGFRGKPEFNEAGCVGCGACAAVCPAGAIRIEDPKPGPPAKRKTRSRVLELRYDRCHFCGACEEHCITGRGIRLSGGFDLALFDRKLAVERLEKELAACEECGVWIAPRHQMQWLFDRLGGLAFAGPALFLSAPPGLPPDPAATPAGRGDGLRILCPACRRRSFLAEAWNENPSRPLSSPIGKDSAHGR